MEMKIMTAVEIKWSIHVFFLRPAKIPNPIPSGTEKITEKTLITKEVGNLSAMISIADAFGWMVTDVPQSHFVTIFPSQFQYCSSNGLS